MAAKNLTAARLRELLHYDPETGLFRRIAQVKGRHVGDVAGNLDAGSGYVVIVIDRRRYYAHRLAFLYLTDRWPTGMVDHRNGARADNAWANLRDSTRLLNQQNQRRARSDNTSGLLGAHRKGKRWASKIRVDGAYIRLGSFATPEAAHAAYVVAKRIHHEGCTL